MAALPTARGLCRFVAQPVARLGHREMPNLRHTCLRVVSDMPRSAAASERRKWNLLRRSLRSSVTGELERAAMREDREITVTVKGVSSCSTSSPFGFEDICSFQELYGGYYSGSGPLEGKAFRKNLYWEMLLRIMTSSPKTCILKRGTCKYLNIFRTFKVLLHQNLVPFGAHLLTRPV